MNIALLGYGKMGKAIEEIALKKGHTIGLKVNGNEHIALHGVDVAIDFSLPSAAVYNITTCIEAGIPVVSGTTGWLENYDNVVSLCKKQGGAFLYASNFSVGVNIFFELNKRLAQLMQGQEQYATSIKEIHHTQKLDAPSGTAITLAEDMLTYSNKTAWELSENEVPMPTKVAITSEREGSVPGTHIVNYHSEIDTIQIRHEAHSRAGFAQGAIIAAEWLAGKQGVFSMADVLNIK